MRNLPDLLRKADTLKADYLSAIDRYKREKAEVSDKTAHLTHLGEAQAILQEVAQELQGKVHGRISGLVTRCLRGVFGDEYAFDLQFEQKRGKTEATPVFLRNGIVLDPLTASGGGVVDVAAFSLRLAQMELSRPPLRKLLVLDEPFKFVSEEFIGSVARLLEVLTEEMGVQIVLVTHLKELELGGIVRLGRERVEV